MVPTISSLTVKTLDDRITLIKKKSWMWVMFKLRVNVKMIVKFIVSTQKIRIMIKLLVETGRMTKNRGRKWGPMTKQIKNFIKQKRC